MTDVVREFGIDLPREVRNDKIISDINAITSIASTDHHENQ